MPAADEVLGTVTVAKESVVADSLQAAGKSVEQKTADELVSLQSHGFLALLMPIILPTEGDSILLGTDQVLIGNGDPMCIASQIIEDLFGSAEGPLGVDDPFGVAQRCEIVGKGLRTVQRLEVGKERQPPGLEGVLQPFEEQATESPGEDTHREKEVRPASDPVLVIG